MCLIIVCEKNIPSIETMQKANNYNNDGIGVAYRKDGKVVVKKDLNVKEAYNLLTSVELPAIVHFRLATAGGASKKLIHPFIIDKHSDVSNKSFETDKAVLFQNGHYSDYEDKLINLCIHQGFPVPSGPMSDSRAIAIMVSVLGDGLLKLIKTSKFVVFSTKNLKVFGDDWIVENGMKFSNKHFETVYDYKDWGNLNAYNGRYHDDNMYYCWDDNRKIWKRQKYTR